MEYVKDIFVGTKQGQVEKNRKEKSKKRKNFINKCLKHKMVVTIVLATISFMILDLLLITNFINILTVM